MADWKLLPEKTRATSAAVSWVFRREQTSRDRSTRCPVRRATPSCGKQSPTAAIPEESGRLLIPPIAERQRSKDVPVRSICRQCRRAARAPASRRAWPQSLGIPRVRVSEDRAAELEFLEEHLPSCKVRLRLRVRRWPRSPRG